jgi:hypothetical protein
MDRSAEDARIAALIRVGKSALFEAQEALEERGRNKAALDLLMMYCDCTTIERGLLGLPELKPEPQEELPF